MSTSNVAALNMDFCGFGARAVVPSTSSRSVVNAAVFAPAVVLGQHGRRLQDAGDRATQEAKAESAALGVKQIDVSDEEMIERLFFSMINEGAFILEEGIALRPSDIDVVYANGYGMARYRAGPMCYADTVGLKSVRDAILKYRERYGDLYGTPAPLLEKLANSGKTFRRLES